MELYHFSLPIGDAFEEGHGEHVDIYATARKPVEVVREAHRRIPEVTGVRLDEICSQFQDRLLPQEFLEKLRSMDYQFSVELYKDDKGTHLLEADTGCDIPEEMARIWAFLLNQVDSELDVQLDPINEVPSLIASYRGDRSIGYGLFR